MSSTDKSEYPLGQGVFSSPRLDLQYFKILQALGGDLIDPIIPHESPGLKIADVCCGTGYFFVNIKTDPSTELHALDVDLSRLPPKAFLPNLTQHTWDINDPAPADLISTFDIVNCQLLFTFTTDNTIDKVFQNILSLLKPGGHIQWAESCIIDEQIISPDPDYTPEFMPKVFTMLPELYTSPMPTWPPILDEVFARNGVEVLNTNRAVLEPRQYKSWTLNQCVVYDELVAYLETTVKTEERRVKVQAFADLVRKAHWEAQVKNVASFLPLIRVAGRKQA